MSRLSNIVDSLRARALNLQKRAVTPFSQTPSSAIVLLRDGTWVPGVRIESASYSLVLPALVNAFTTAVALGRLEDVEAFVLSRPFRDEESLYVRQLPAPPFVQQADDVWARRPSTTDDGIPLADAPLSPFLSQADPSPEEGITCARRIAGRAHVPDSGFRVGAVLESTEGRLIPGVNVEHPDWSRTLCAERNALGTFFSYGVPSANRLFLSCPDDPQGTPCGACRQLLVERLPDTKLWMDRHEATHESASPSSLLPGSFQGHVLLRDQGRTQPGSSTKG